MNFYKMNEPNWDAEFLKYCRSADFKSFPNWTSYNAVISFCLTPWATHVFGWLHSISFRKHWQNVEVNLKLIRIGGTLWNDSWFYGSRFFPKNYHEKNIWSTKRFTFIFDFMICCPMHATIALGHFISRYEIFTLAIGKFTFFQQNL